MILVLIGALFENEERYCYRIQLAEAINDITQQKCH